MSVDSSIKFLSPLNTFFWGLCRCHFLFSALLVILHNFTKYNLEIVVVFSPCSRNISSYLRQYTSFEHLQPSTTTSKISTTTYNHQPPCYILEIFVSTKTRNDLKPPKTTYNHLQPSTTIYNHLQPSTTTSKISTTTYNHLKNIYSHSQTI